MSQSFKDQVRLRWPRAMSIYQRYVAPRLGGGTIQIELSDWTQRGVDLVQRTGMHGIRFERDGVWVDDGAGALWAYEPGPMTTTLGSEFGMRYEQGEIEALAARLQGGGTLVDIGANVGLHSIQLARMVDGLRVLAFEPVGETFALLERNIAKNGVTEQVEPRRLAVSDAPGTLRLTKRYRYGNFVVPDGTAIADGVAEEVQARTLDDLVDELTDRVDAIKCDVEGAELSVLKGATRTLERFKPILLIEVDQRWAARYGHTGADVFSFLQQHGYGYERFVDGQLRPASGSPEADLADSCNFMFHSMY